MQDRETTSWRRKSDPSTVPEGKRADEPRETPMQTNAQKLETWEDEGGRTGRRRADGQHLFRDLADSGRRQRHALCGRP
jgi:hypothetical protein